MTKYKKDKIQKGQDKIQGKYKKTEYKYDKIKSKEIQMRQNTRIPK